MKQLIPEIYVKNCKEALDVYHNLFGGEVKNLQMSDNNELFAGIQNKVIHSELHVNSRCVIYFVDIFDPKRAQVGNVTLVLHMDSKEELEKAYETLRVDGHVGMELQQTFWGAWHAIVTDRFGAPWALNYAER